MTPTNPPRKDIVGLARSLHQGLWDRWKDIYLVSPSPSSFYPVRLDSIVRKVLAIQLEETAYVPKPTRGEQFETAGLIDRHLGAIIISEKYSIESRRFTTAHEIGHWVLHPGVAYHRDRPLIDGAPGLGTRPLEEVEADRFAAELLMPRKAVESQFLERFDKQMDCTRISDGEIHWLSAGSGRRLNERELLGNRRGLSLVLAQAFSCQWKHFRPMKEVFAVSSSAMAIRLEELGLVV